MKTSNSESKPLDLQIARYIYATNKPFVHTVEQWRWTGGANVRSPPLTEIPQGFGCTIITFGSKISIIIRYRYMKPVADPGGDRGDISPHQSFWLHVGGFILYNFFLLR